MSRSPVQFHRAPSWSSSSTRPANPESCGRRRRSRTRRRRTPTRWRHRCGRPPTAGSVLAGRTAAARDRQAGVPSGEVRSPPSRACKVRRVAWPVCRSTHFPAGRSGIVDRVGGSPHVHLPCIGARFPATTGLLLAPEGAADFSARSPYVDVGDPAVGSRRGHEDLRFRVGRR
jgi:hypothetical protein